MHVAIGATVPFTSARVPAAGAISSHTRSWLSSAVGRRARIKRYAHAMGWEETPAGDLVGEIEGISIRVYEGENDSSVLELHAPGVLPRIEARPWEASVEVFGDGLRHVPTGDLTFDRYYMLRAAEPWLARAVVDVVVRRALLAAPPQSWVTSGEYLVAQSPTALDPLDALARATALLTVIHAVPWEAYADPLTAPTPAAVQAVVSQRRSRPLATLPSMPRRA